MKNIIRLILLIISSSVYSQELVHDVHFTFENSQITDNGENYFFEVDIMIQTINSTGSFKLGSGQLYFNYNTDAFGANIMENSRVEFSYPEDSGYLCAQGIDAVAGAKIYGSFTINDNTTSRVSWAFSQNFSASTFAMDNVTEIPAKLCHLKIQFIDSEQSPLLTYESGTVYDDQFYTACGPINGNPFQTADCGAEAGTQLLNDSFDSSGSTLISDTTAPVITLLGDNPVTIEVGSTYTDAGATALDNYDGDISSNIIVTGSVDTNTLGTYTITYSLTDSSGNTALEVTRTVNVVDTTAPVITLLGDNPVTIEVGSTYTDAGATALDNYDGDISSNIIVTGSVDTNTLGTYTITYSLTDSSGNTALEVTRTVNVVDTTAPVITLLGDNPVTIEVGSTYTDAGATALDNYDGDISSNIIVTGSVDTNTLGTYTITYSLTDSSGNTALEVTRTVNVVDTTAPVITLLGDNPVTIEVGSTYTDAGATALDNYDGDISSNIIVTGSVDTNTLGTYTITYSLTDSSGNTALEVTRTVNVVDTTAPVITLLGDNPVTIEVGSTYTDAGATALDNYDGDISSNIIVTGSVDTNTLGTYTITYSLTDSSGNTALEVTRTVNVVDTTAPVITLLGDNPVTIEVGSTYTDAGATALDNYDGDISSNIIVTGSVDTNTLGTYTITYSLTDSSGNTALEVTRTVNVVDTTAPVITLLGDNPVTIEVGSTYTDAGATALDNYDGDISSNIIVTGSVDTNTLGTYTITYSLTDSSGNTALEVTRTVNVVDTTAPVITLLGDNPVTIEVGSTYTDAGATALDNYDGDISSNIIVTGSVDTNTLGTYTITYSLTDSSGNTALEVTRTVNVVDTTAPVITLLGDNPVTIEVGSTYTDAGATALDNYDGDISSNIIVTGSVDTNTLGAYTITYSLTDSSGNTALEVTRTVYVENGLSLSDMEIMELKIFPNPTSSIWQIKSSRIIESIALFNLIGKRLMYKETFSDHIQIDATSFPDGVYLILINKNNMVRLIKH